MSIRAIFYDLDGTLRMNHPNSFHAFAEFASELGLKVSKEDRLRAARWEHYYFAESPELLADRKAFPDRVSFWSNFGLRELIVLGASPQEATELAPKLQQLMNNSYHPEDIIPDDLLKTLQILKKRGFLLGVLSNREESFDDYLVDIGLGDYFSISIYAGELGIYKPNPEIFHYLLDKAGVQAQDAMYVGDNYYADVVGSRNVGMSPVLLDIHGLFNEPDCPVIQTHNQLLALTEASQG